MSRKARVFMQDYYLAIDIGASSGRHLIGYLENEKLVFEEVHRFENYIYENENCLIWPIEYIYDQVLLGIKKCAELGKIPKSVGIDTWGVDFVLLDENNQIIGNAVSYRDSRTNNMSNHIFNKITEEELYLRTGIQKQLFNTIVQLMSIKQQNRDLDCANSLLLIPDYLNYKLTGKMVSEYTNATTTQLVNLETKDWDWELIEQLGFPKRIFKSIKKAGTSLGSVTNEVQRILGFNVEIILPASHDTGSAIVAIPTLEQRSLYISSGTWSLIGTESDSPINSIECMRMNFTNEGGYNDKYRFLKNIMGLWIIQSVRKELDNEFSFEELCTLASRNTHPAVIDVNDNRFLAPRSMIKAIQDYCFETNQTIPINPGELSFVVYNSLAISYKNVISEIEQTTRKEFDTIYIIGGGSNATYLNHLTSKLTGKIVKAGPSEATAMGNILVQMISNNVFTSITDARECLSKSINIETFMEKK